MKKYGTAGQATEDKVIQCRKDASSYTLISGSLGLWTEVKEGVEYDVGVTLEVGIHRFPPGVGVRWKE